MPRPRAAVAATYAAQGFGYACAVTALPGVKLRTGADDTAVSLTVLLGCLTAALGSVLAERISTRRSSADALLLGLGVQVVALPLVATSASVGALLAAFGLYGVGLGLVDAASNIQGVLVQHRLGRPVMSTLFAAYTSAAIGGALVQSALARLGTATGAVTTLAVAAVFVLAGAVVARPGLVRGQSLAFGPDQPAPSRDPLPTRGIWLFGSMVLVAFVVDSSVSTWSSVYLHDSLAAGAVVAPLGYAAYQAAILATRLVGDRAVHRRGRAPVVVTTVLVAIVGLLLVAAVPHEVAAVVGFALAGVGVGALVPLTFSAAGELAPGRVDEVIARINLFNYIGAVLGAVVLGLLSAWPGLGVAFALPALLLVPALAASRRFDHPSVPTPSSPPLRPSSLGL